LPYPFAGRTFRLNRLLDSPVEGPADIDATFRVVEPESHDLDALQETEDLAIAGPEDGEPLTTPLME
jgi:hypothetical protein